MAASQFQIERGIPMPRLRARYPFGEMEVGDSFAAPLIDERRIRTAANAYGRNHGVKFSVRNNDAGTVRVWRIT